MATIDPAALAKELGIIFTKVTTITAGNFDLYLNQIFPGLWTQKEQFGAFIIMDTPIQGWNVEIELVENETLATVSLLSGIVYPLRGTRFLSAGTTATTITVFGGQ